ncbi:hypothetical protein PGS49_22660 [Yersinia intermedia]|nr:hypothetical protein [Yersinia intermedia]MDA5483403.1 hypothetical protein [Yersinia intermedia]
MIILFGIVAIGVFVIIFSFNETSRRRKHQAFQEAKKKKFRDGNAK